MAVDNNICETIGNTPLILLKSLSVATGCKIYGKCEFMNPGGSCKDRVALQAVADAETRGLISRHSGVTLVEGTSGSTGVSLALVASALGYKCIVFMPDDVAREKSDMVIRLGAEVRKVRPVAYSNNAHYVHCARAEADRIASKSISSSSSWNEQRSALFIDQFENTSNFRAHYLHTGPEILRQCEERRVKDGITGSSGAAIDAFVCGAGTGGTLAGVASYLKSKLPKVVACLVDPPGSSLFNLVKFGVAFAPQQAERTLKRHRDDTIIEGVGLDRVTSNMSRALPHVSEAFKCSDEEAVLMSRYLLYNEGIFVGGSSAMNCVGAVKLARKLGPKHTIVTILCDRGERTMSRFWNDDEVRSRGLNISSASESINVLFPPD
jgi:cysteine synthase A